jgi:oxygen-dependent protoporphyrinogen oxidase
VTVEVSPSLPHVIVIGGGAAGLSAARTLIEARDPSGAPRVRVTLLEATGRLGGKIFTERVDGLTLETGPDALFLRDRATIPYLQALGLGDRLVRANDDHRRAYVLRRGRLLEIPPGMEGGVPRDIWKMARSDLLSPIGKLRAAAEVLIPRGRLDGDDSVDAFIRRRFGGEVAERVAAPLLGNIYSHDIRGLSLLTVAPHLRTAEREHRSLLIAAQRTPVPGRPAPAGPAPSLAARAIGGVVGGARRLLGKSGPPAPRPPSPFVTLNTGLDGLVDALAGRLTGVEIRFDATVRAIAPRATGYSVALGVGDTIDADGIVLTAPAFVAAEFLRPTCAPAADILAGIHYTSATIVAFAFPAGSDAHLPPGSGVVVTPGDPCRFAAYSWTSRKWPHAAPDGRVVIRCHLHIDDYPRLSELDDAALAKVALADLNQHLHLTAAPSFTKVYRFPRALAAYTVGHQDRLADAERLLGVAMPGVHLAGAGYRGAGIPACLIDGAAAAQRVLATIGTHRKVGSATA